MFQRQRLIPRSFIDGRPFKNRRPLRSLYKSEGIFKGFLSFCWEGILRARDSLRQQLVYGDSPRQQLVYGDSPRQELVYGDSLLVCKTLCASSSFIWTPCPLARLCGPLPSSWHMWAYMDSFTSSLSIWTPYYLCHPYGPPTIHIATLAFSSSLWTPTGFLGQF